MARVTNSPRGTAYRARIRNPDFRMAGKTGTVQVRRISKAEREQGVRKNNELEWQDRDHAFFRQDGSVLGREPFEMVGGQRAIFGGHYRALEVAQLLGVQLDPHAQFACLVEHLADLRGRKADAFAKPVDRIDQKQADHTLATLSEKGALEVLLDSYS